MVRRRKDECLTTVGLDAGWRVRLLQDKKILETSGCGGEQPVTRGRRGTGPLSQDQAQGCQRVTERGWKESLPG